MINLLFLSAAPPQFFTMLEPYHFQIATGILIFAYIFIAIEKVPKAVTALIGASIVVLLKILEQEEAFHFIDFNVIFLLTGMMIIVHITSRSGVFRWMALETARFAQGDPVKIMIIFSIITAIFSALLDNVTTVLLMAPITLVIAKEQNISPFPYFISEILASNIGGTATLIGDPPNIMIGSAAKLDFMSFVQNLTPPVVVVFILFIGIMYLWFRKDLVVSEEKRKELCKIDNSNSITNKNLLIKCSIVLFFVVLGFIFHGTLHYEASTIAMAGASILLLFESPKEIIEEVEWTTIFFFIGLFIIIGAVEKVGLIGFLAEEALQVTHKDLALTTVLILWVSAFLSAIIDNIPYTATMIPIIQHLSHYMNPEPLWWSLALGACLGGNGTIIGASANVIVADMSTSAGFPIKFLTFMKYGMTIMIMSLIVSTAYLLLRFGHLFFVN